MRVVVCALAKNEHKYINEWVKHYFSIGVDKIFLFDNDDKDSPNIKDFIDKQYLPKMKIINARGVHFDKMQSKFYYNFYKNEKENFEWCLFCDVDEFLTGITDIKHFLSKKRFNNFEQIRIKWKLFGDDDLIERDMTKGVMKTFTKEAKITLTSNLQEECKLYNQGKCIVKGHLNNVVFNSVHFASKMSFLNPILLRSCLPSGRQCLSLVEIKEDYSYEHLFINHYMTKSLSEFVEQKLKRTDAVFANRTLKLDYYWRINKKTPEKMKYLQDMGLEK